MFAEGQVIAGKYRLTKLLGQGGMGAVWGATNELIARPVAIKVLLPEVASHPESMQRFFNEARICGSIRHPGIVDVLDLGRAENGAPFIVMEMLNGHPLSALIERRKRLLPSDVLPVVRDVARTLALTHQKGVIHRDLKPENIFMHRLETGQTIAKVLDFGISKVAAPEGAMKLTRTGTVFGSPAYMSPEQAAGEGNIDHRTDIYSLGVVLYEALSGQLPFTDQNYNTVIVNIVVKTPPDITSLVPGIPGELASIVQKAMAKDRSARFQTMDELANRLDKLLPSLKDFDKAILDAWGEAADAQNRKSFSGKAFAHTIAAPATTSPGQTKKTWVAPAVGGAVIVFLGTGVALAVLAMRDHSSDHAPVSVDITDSATPSAQTVEPAPSIVPADTSAEPIATTLPSGVTTGTSKPTTSASAAKTSPSAPRPTSSQVAPKPKKDGGMWEWGNN